MALPEMTQSLQSYAKAAQAKAAAKAAHRKLTKTPKKRRRN
jgi:hypothetical protein